MGVSSGRAPLKLLLAAYDKPVGALCRPLPGWCHLPAWLVIIDCGAHCGLGLDP